MRDYFGTVFIYEPELDERLGPESILLSRLLTGVNEIRPKIMRFIATYIATLFTRIFSLIHPELHVE